MADSLAEQENQTGERSESVELFRIGAFSDGIFAIAMTLLVLSIEVPKIPDALVSSELPKRLGEIFTSDLIAYFISFAVIAVYWRIHHQLFSKIVRYDGLLITLNFVLLAFVALIPFPTQLISDYGDDPYAIATYATSLTLVSISALAVQYHVDTAGLKEERLTRKEARSAVWANSGPTLLFLLSIPLAFIIGGYVPFIWLGLPLVEVLIGRFTKTT